MAAQNSWRRHFGRITNVPDANGLVVACRGQPPPVGPEHQRPDPIPMTLQAAQYAPGGSLIQNDGLSGERGTSRQDALVARQCQLKTGVCRAAPELIPC